MGDPVGDTVVARLRRAGCVFAEDEAALLQAAAAGPALDALVARRVAGEPLEHVLGWVEFRGRRLAVSPGVFVPRRRTQILAAIAADALPPRGVLVELCCGVAPVAATVDGDGYACDVDACAVACARRNMAPDRVFLGDLFDALPAALRGRVDVLVANAPYVPSAEVGLMPREARCHEPRIALDGGPDGLDVHRRIAAGAAPWLAAGGTVIVETSRRQAPTSLSLFRDAGFDAEIVSDGDVDGTAVIARRSVVPRSG